MKILVKYRSAENCENSKTIKVKVNYDNFDILCERLCNDKISMKSLLSKVFSVSDTKIKQITVRNCSTKTSFSVWIDKELFFIDFTNFKELETIEFNF